MQLRFALSKGGHLLLMARRVRQPQLDVWCVWWSYRLKDSRQRCHGRLPALPGYRVHPLLRRGGGACAAPRGAQRRKHEQRQGEHAKRAAAARPVREVLAADRAARTLNTSSRRGRSASESK
jgi:hypothetical protein